MKVVITTTEGDYGGDHSLELELKTETKSVSVCFGAGEPEDMSLARDLNDAYSLEDLVEAAYKAGLRGESYEVEYIEED